MYAQIQDIADRVWSKDQDKRTSILESRDSAQTEFQAYVEAFQALLPMARVLEAQVMTHWNCAKESSNDERLQGTQAGTRLILFHLDEALARLKNYDDSITLVHSRIESFLNATDRIATMLLEGIDHTVLTVPRQETQR